MRKDDRKHPVTEGQGVSEQHPEPWLGDQFAEDEDAPTIGKQHGGINPERASSPPEQRAGASQGELIAADENVTLDRQDLRDINAVQVRMDRSGAEHIDAQRVTMTNSGAKSMSVQSAQLDKSGVLMLSGDRAVFQGSSSVLARVRELRIARSRVGIAQSGTTTIENDSRIGVMSSGNVVAGGDIDVAFLFAGSVRAEGDVHVTFNPPAAAALGAGLAAGLLLFRRLLDRD